MSVLDSRIATLRADTPGTANIIHFNHAGLSLSPTPVLRTVIDHLHLEAEIGGYEAAAVANDRIEAGYVSIARMLNSSTDEIARNLAGRWNASIVR